eukprot:TRINITY_DN18547_c0_g1_i1.p1 TRINITY_DN18547_c0_g1~~TRINITY_DN18547_c0_g1_i1.p1  ORF type:complete len:279 (-),score=66.81 TRINITY_DN18547_c0_g1_i1:310-1146(-)
MDLKSLLAPMAAAFAPLEACKGSESVVVAGNTLPKDVDLMKDIDISVVMVSGKKIALQVKNLDTIQHVKEEIQDLEGIPREQQVLIYEGQQLKNTWTVYESNVKDKSIVDLLRVKPLKLLVKQGTGQNCTVEARPEDTITDVKLLVQEQVAIPHDQITLVGGGKKLEDGCTLRECGIETDTTLYVVLRLRGCGQFFVESSDGERFRIDGACPDKTIQTVKASIQDKTGIPAAEQQLSFDGQQLEDACTLQDYGIKKESIICLRRRGDLAKLYFFCCCW